MDEGILGHLRELDEAAGDWERYQPITLAELRTDRDKRNMVLHALLITIQASIDIANHLVAACKLPAARDLPGEFRDLPQIEDLRQLH
jgi:uncharacterized protein YutE (UPF0331/DUF86 family)